MGAALEGECNKEGEGRTLETSAFKNSLRWPIYVINSADNTKLPSGIILVRNGIKTSLSIVNHCLHFVFSGWLDQETYY